MCCEVRCWERDPAGSEFPAASWDFLLLEFLESISYVVDIYRGEIRPASILARERAEAAAAKFVPGGTSLRVELRGLLNFACYIAQFPHLVAGPIIRFQQLETQMYDRTHTIEKFARGIFFLCLGFGKKIMIADTMGEVADLAFGGHPAVWSDAWFGMLAYAFQIYFDFSGYSDMALGLGLMFGFEFPKNFDSPTIRQHHRFLAAMAHDAPVSMRDYLYIGLGGNRRGRLRTYLNLMLVMLLGGLCTEHHGHLSSGAESTASGLPSSGRWAKQMPEAVATSFLASPCFDCALRGSFRSVNVTGAWNYLLMLFRFNTVATPIIKLAHIGMWTRTHVFCMIAAALIAFLGIQTRIWQNALRRRERHLCAGGVLRFHRNLERANIYAIHLFSILRQEMTQTMAHIDTAGSGTIGRGTAWVLGLVFMIGIFVPGAYQTYYDLHFLKRSIFADLLTHSPTSASLQQFEKDLTQQSRFDRWVRHTYEKAHTGGEIPPATTIIGEDGFLFTVDESRVFNSYSLIARSFAGGGDHAYPHRFPRSASRARNSTCASADSDEAFDLSGKACD